MGDDDKVFEDLEIRLGDRIRELRAAEREKERVIAKCDRALLREGAALENVSRLEDRLRRARDERNVAESRAEAAEQQVSELTEDTLPAFVELVEACEQATNALAPTLIREQEALRSARAALDRARVVESGRED